MLIDRLCVLGCLCGSMSIKLCLLDGVCWNVFVIMYVCGWTECLERILSLQLIMCVCVLKCVSDCGC